MKLFRMIMLMVVVSVGLYHTANAAIGSYLSEQWQAFKQLPGALQDCLVKKNCTPDQKKSVTVAAQRIGIAVTAILAVAASVYAGSKLIDNRILFNDLEKESQQKLLNSMVTELNKSRFQSLKDMLSKVRFNQSQMDDYLTLAVQASEPDIVALFLKYGASPQVVDRDGNSLLYWAARRSMFSEPGKPDYERATKIIDMLLARNAPLDKAGQDGKTPLMWMARNKELVEKFLKKGADKSKRDNDGMSALDYATDPDVKALLK